MRTWAACAAILMTLAGCANTPPGKLTDADFYRQDKDFDTPPQVTLENFLGSSRYCGPQSSGVIFVQHYGLPQCATASSGKKTSCDMYVSDIGGGASGFVLGRIDLEPNASGGTHAEFRARSMASHPERTAAAWIEFARGRGKEICSD